MFRKWIRDASEVQAVQLGGADNWLPAIDGDGVTSRAMSAEVIATNLRPDIEAYFQNCMECGDGGVDSDG